MEEINDDIIRTIKILSLEKDDSYSKIYMNSNEDKGGKKDGKTG